MIEIQNTNKDLLAKLMATEDINVLHKNVPTAYFDVKNRTLVCPILKEDMRSEERRVGKECRARRSRYR